MLNTYDTADSKGSETDFLANDGAALDQSNNSDPSVKERLAYAIE